jgi:hypothetical protein
MSFEKASIASESLGMPQLDILPWHDGDYYFQAIFEDGLGRLKGGEPRMIHQWKELQVLCEDFWTILDFEEGLREAIPIPILTVLTLWKKPDSLKHVNGSDYLISYISSAVDGCNDSLAQRPWLGVSQPLQGSLDGIGGDIVSKGNELLDALRSLPCPRSAHQRGGSNASRQHVTKVRCTRMDAQGSWSLASSREGSSNLLTAFWVFTDFTEEHSCFSKCYWQPAEDGRSYGDGPATEGKLSILNASSGSSSTLGKAPLAGP